MKVVSQHYIGTTEEWKKKNPKLYEAVWGFEKTADGKLLAKLGNGADLWNDLKYFDIENIKDLPEKLQGILAEAERTMRKTAEEIFQEEVKTREEEDEALQEAIETEVKKRKEADQALQTAVENEVRTREEEVQDLQEQTQINSQAISSERTKRKTNDQKLQSAIDAEEAARLAVELALNGEIEDINNELEGVNAVELQGDKLSRVINGFTPVAKNLLDPSAVFVENKTLICDMDGTIGKYIGDVDSATINVQTLSISPISTNEPRLLATVNAFADLPLTVADAEALGWNTPRVDDYAQVRVDETNSNNRVEWYIGEIDDNGNITWGNPVILNTSDFQEQTTALDAGMVLTGGDRPGTFGMPLGVDTEPTAGSSNLVSSNAVAQADEAEAQERQNADTNLQNQINAMANVIYPIGTIYETVDPADLSNWLGFTWSRWGQGRVSVGVDTGDSDFNTVERTDGTSTVALTKTQMPRHTHTQKQHSHSQNSHSHETNINSSGIGDVRLAYGNSYLFQYSEQPRTPTINSATAINNYEGGNATTEAESNGQAHENKMKYITCYKWKRTA